LLDNHSKSIIKMRKKRGEREGEGRGKRQGGDINKPTPLDTQDPKKTGLDPVGELRYQREGRDKSLSQRQRWPGREGPPVRF